MLQTTTSRDTRPYWRKKIIPFGGLPTDQKLFPVGWKAYLVRFEEIIDDLKALIVRELTGFRHILSQHVPDLLQQGWLRLWRQLHDNPSFLERMSRFKAADYVSNRCGTSNHLAEVKRYDSYHEISRWDDLNTAAYEDSITEIVIGSSLKSSGKPGHALFTRHTDILIDIERVMHEMAAWCGDDMRKLVALYYVTTSVSQSDVAMLAGGSISLQPGRKPRSNILVYWTRVVKQKLQELLANYRPIEPHAHIWRECLKQGDAEPIVQLAEKYVDNPVRLLALYVLTTRVSFETAAHELGVDYGALCYAGKLLRQELRWMYASRVVHQT